MFKTHATISFLVVHTQFITIRTTIKTKATAATTKAGPFSIIIIIIIIIIIKHIFTG